MLDIDHIVQTALTPIDSAKYADEIKANLGQPSKIPRYTPSSAPLSLVRFDCLLQDTGYPLEVYLPGVRSDNEGEIDWSRLKERWVGWGVEIPGEQCWVKAEDDLPQLNHLSLESRCLPSPVLSKYPLPGKDGKYLGALIKVYDEVSYKPATTHQFVGILSQSSMPNVEHDDPEVVPTIHVLQVIPAVETSTAPSTDEQTREELLDYLATGFKPYDRIAAEYLLLLLISSPAVRQPTLPPLGTLSVCFKRKSVEATANLLKVIEAVTPRVVPLSLTIPLLHSHSFSPSSNDSSSLDAGLLQLADGTVLVLDEDGMGGGGQLNQKALDNLKALIDCVNEQRVRYHYPYMDSLKMDCAVRIAVLSQAKSLLPVDIHIPIQGTGQAKTTAPDIAVFRSYIAQHGSAGHASKLIIPEETGQLIQNSFVEERRRGETDAEGALKRRMKVARLMALSYSEATLTREIWEKTVRLDEEITQRHASI